MSRTFIFFTLGLIMLILATMAAFEFGQEFSNFRRENGQMVTGSMSHEGSTGKMLQSETPKESLNTHTKIEEQNVLSSQNLPTNNVHPDISGTHVPLDNNNPMVHKDIDLEDNTTNHQVPVDGQSAIPFTDDMFVWLTEAPSQLKKDEKAITQTRLAIGKKQLSFKVTGADTLKTRTMLLENPDRFVLDIQGKWGILLPPTPPANPWLKKIRLGLNNGYTRLVFELEKKPSSAEVKQIGKNKIEVIIQ